PSCAELCAPHRERPGRGRPTVVVGEEACTGPEDRRGDGAGSRMGGPERRPSRWCVEETSEGGFFPLTLGGVHGRRAANQHACLVAAPAGRTAPDGHPSHGPDGPLLPRQPSAAVCAAQAQERVPEDACPVPL